ncbi:MAG TPA: hypothetical protein VN451_06510 [Chitinophagaceae bacterium]|nr:hypothetical protein [Chitinophagaceae bacterium]
MKKIILLSMILSACVNCFSQGVAINNNNATADASAMLDISSTSKGLLIPRMNTSEKTSIASPARGLIVYDSDTQSFWYYTGLAWKELLFSGADITPTGIAGGDLYGNYPSPNVGKIQNLDVAFGVPFDKQVMKWDMLNNRWQGENDSLFLPYNVSSANVSKLFGVTNANTSNGATAIFGKSGSGSGIAPALSIGVWGDNASGAGMLGTSNSGTGVYGYSVQNYGVYGYSGSSNYAGVYGSCNAFNGTSVMGDAYGGGTGIYGKANGTTGKAGYFRNTNVNNTDTALTVQHDGTGRGVYISLNNVLNTTEAFTLNNLGAGTTMSLSNTNTSNTGTFVSANYTGTGIGISMNIPNILNNSPAVFVQHYGTGSGIASYGFKGKAGLFQVPAATNANSAISVSTLGTGNAADFLVNNAGNSSSAVSISTNGTGRGLQSIISNGSNMAAALYGSSSGNKGVEGIAQVNGVIGQSTGLTGGIGVLGQSSLNSNDGIGVKGVSYSNYLSSGSVTGINFGTGVGVYGQADAAGAIGVSGFTANGVIGTGGENAATDGIGIYGIAYGTNGTGVFGDAGQYNSQSHAAIFRNVYASNSLDVVQITNSGTGTNLLLNCYNASNANRIFWARNSGTGAFLYFDDGAGVAKVRIDHAGKGFFNGGTQTGGADLAEAFDVVDDIKNYEPGDVLIISTDKDRTVVKSNGAYSTLVAGVYATKPGVLMTEENIDADLSGKVPMGVVGVIPTKVCLEGGAISRGDMLVTSSQPGIAMKADPEKLKTGQVIGKALENYVAQGTGKIKVLVNVK